MKLPQGNGSRENEPYTDGGGRTGKLKGIPDARYENSGRIDDCEERGSDARESLVVERQTPRGGEQEAVQVEPEREEHDREDEHDVDDVAQPHRVVQERAERDSEVRVEVGEDVVQGGVAEEEEGEEARRDVDDGAKRQRGLHDRPDLRPVLELVVDAVNCTQKLRKIVSE